MLRMELSVLPFHSLGRGDGFTCAERTKGNVGGEFRKVNNLQKETQSIVEIMFCLLVSFGKTEAESWKPEVIDVLRDVCSGLSAAIGRRLLTDADRR